MRYTIVSMPFLYVKLSIYRKQDTQKAKPMEQVSLHFSSLEFSSYLVDKVLKCLQI